MRSTCVECCRARSPVPDRVLLSTGKLTTERTFPLGAASPAAGRGQVAVWRRALPMVELRSGPVPLSKVLIVFFSLPRTNDARFSGTVRHKPGELLWAVQRFLA